MASVVTQEILSSSWNFLFLRSPYSVVQRSSSRIVPKQKKRGTIKYRNLIQSDCQSLADRGFLRSQKPYTPPPDVNHRINSIFEKFFEPGFNLTDNIPKSKKFSLLQQCWKEFQYGIPNSQLHKISTANDVLKFYTTAIKTTTPYEELREKDLPPNLHVQYESVRFHPETDTKFDGISAFPEMPTVVSGIKSRKKYKGYSSKLPYYYYNEAIFRKPIV